MQITKHKTVVYDLTLYDNEWEFLKRTLHDFLREVRDSNGPQDGAQIDTIERLLTSMNEA